MSFKGLDEERMLAFAADLDLQGRTLLDAHSRLTSSLHATEWWGAIAERFVGEWSTVHTAHVNTSASVLADLAAKLRAEAAQQHGASSTGGGSSTAASVPVRAPKPFISTDLATPQQEKLARKLTDGVIKGHAAGYFPGAVAALVALEAGLSHPPTAVQVESMRRLQGLIRIAMLQRETVKEAADLAVDSFKDGTQSEVSAMKDAFGVAMKPEGGFDHNVEKDVVTSDALHLGMGGVLDKALGGSSSAVVAAYDHNADLMLQHAASQAANVTELGRSQDSVAFESADVLSGRLQEVRLHGIAADATHMITGDGSPTQTVATSVLTNIPEVGRAYSGLAAAADATHGVMEFQVGLGAMKVAQVDSLQGLATAAQVYGLG